MDSDPWFRDITAESQLDFVHAAYGAPTYFFPAIMGGGAAFLDFDCDGRLDILALNTAPIERLGAAAQALPNQAQLPSRGNRLWRQLPTGLFEDVTQQAGLDVPVYGMGVAVGDVNNDGFPDLYLSCYGADHLLMNRRDGTFLDVTEQSGIDNQLWGMSAVFVDFDRDGWLDLFVTNYVDYDPGQLCLSGGEPDFCNPAMFPRTADKLFRNVSGATRDHSQQSEVSETSTIRFEDVSLSSGIALRTGAGLGVTAADWNSDGWQDLYVANDGHANFLWINQRDDRFREEAILWGAAYDATGRSQGSMGVAVGDVNRDQRLDILITNLDGENNALYLNRAGDTFDEVSAARGLASSFPNTGFGTAMVDVELDGDLDIVVVNGRVRRTVDRTAPAQVSPNTTSFWDAYREQNSFSLQDPAGQFRQVSSSQDALLANSAVSRGLAVGDVDNDGDQDLLVSSLGGPLRLLRNDAPRQGHWLSVRVVDPTRGGRDAYGSLVTLKHGDRTWTHVVQPGASYLCSHDPRLHFGLGAETQLDRIEVLWPDGRLEEFPAVTVDQHVTLEYGKGVSP